MVDDLVEEGNTASPLESEEPSGADNISRKVNGPKANLTGKEKGLEPQQKRFSFYNAKEVGSISFAAPSESKIPQNDQESNPNRFNFYDPALLAARDENEPNKQINLKIQTGKTENILEVEKSSPLLETDAGSNDSWGQKTIHRLEWEGQQRTHSSNRIHAGNSNNNAVEILRSLQETEDQRKQILRTAVASTAASASITSNPNGSTNIPHTKGDYKADDVATESSGMNKNGNPPNVASSFMERSIDHDINNPYEDSIKAALSLLRKHRSVPPHSLHGNPEELGAIGDNHYDPENRNIAEDGTPKDQKHNIRHHNSHDEGGESCDDIRSKPLDDVVQEAKLKSRQHKEVIAKYANKLEEFKSTLPPEQQIQLQLSSSYNQSYDEGDLTKPRAHSPLVSQIEDAVRKSENHDNHIHQRINPSLTEDSTGLVSDLSQYSTNNFSYKSQNANLRQEQQVIIEEEVQKGVEKVLVAILEASKTKSTIGSGSDSPCASNGCAISGNLSVKSRNNVNDALLQVLYELLPSSRSMVSESNNSEDGSKGLMRENLRNYSTAVNSEDSCTNNQNRKSSVVDELLAEIDDHDIGNEMLRNGGNQSMKSNTEGQIQSQNPNGCNSDVNTTKNWASDDEKKVIEELSSPVLLSAIHQRRNRDTPATSMDEDVRQSQEGINDNSIYESETSADTDSVSRSSYTDDEDGLDTTYEHETVSYEEEDDNESTHRTRVLGPLSREAGGTTGVVLDVESDTSPSMGSEKEQKGYFSSVVNYVSSSLQPEDEKRILDRKRREEILASYDVVGLTTNIKDEEAMELMRTLCSHLLPFGVDENSMRQQSVPIWDEENSNEPGYRIIRLTRNQLKRVECAFDAMITRLKHNSFNEVEGQFDPNFIRELEAAERLLDDNEKDNQPADDVGSESIIGNATSNLDEPKTVVSNKCKHSIIPQHPDFPGIKHAGKGEMGDLEFFQLPIIYKSHVTGFEPTKDITLEPGNVIAGQYLVESELGSAAFSTAYKCVDLSSDNTEGHEEVCLKVIKNTKDFFDQSLDEIKILELLRQTGKCDENYILRVKTFFYYREHLIIVTELLRQNLFEFGKFILDNEEEPYFTLQRLAYITRQCLIALRFVHNLGLVHSDVKPENILLGSYSRAQIKLIDFGSSCYLTDRQSSYIQSRSYRAPEVVLGLPYSGKIDVWSLGCVVAEMYTGEVTFQNDSIVSMLSRIEALRGSFPRHMIAQGRQSSRFFTKSGLLYEVVGESDDEELGSELRNPPAPDDEGSDNERDLEGVEYDIFQPKKTSLSSRLGFDEDLMSDYRKRGTPVGRQLEQIFTDFVARLLTIDPDARPTAEEALQHPYMLYAASLTETEIKYPRN